MQIPVIKIIKVVTFNMNPKFTEVTLNSFIFIMDIFCTNLARKFGMIILHMKLVPVYYSKIRISKWNLIGE